MDRKVVNIAVKKCVACGECAYWCPRGAVSAANGIFAVVDTALCVGCGLCAKNCPAGCIEIQQKEAQKNA